MQLKGLVRFVAIALIALCLFQLSFTWMAHRVESKAEATVKSLMKISDSEKLPDSLQTIFKAKRNHILDSMNTEVVYNLGVVKYTYQDCKQQELAMGLDLQGGMSVVLQVSEEDLVDVMSGKSQDPAFRKAFEKAKAAQVNSQENFVTLFKNAYKEVAPEGRLAAIFSTPELHDKISFNASNDDVMRVIEKEVNEAVKRTHNIIASRIDKFGVTQPNISLEERTGRIIVELPGVDNPDRVRKYLQATAKLEFWETFENAEIAPSLDQANKLISQHLEALAKEKKDTSKSAVTLTAASEDTSKKAATALLPASAGNENTPANGKNAKADAKANDTSASARKKLQKNH